MAFALAMAVFAVSPAAAHDGPEPDPDPDVVPAVGEIDFMAPFDTDLPEKIRKANAECYGCHSEQGVKHPVRPDMDIPKLSTMTVNAAGYDAGSHTGIDCRDCHAVGYGNFPHAKTVRTKACIDCHNRHVPSIEKELERSVHNDRLASKFTCESCHDPHLYQVAAKIVVPKRIVEQDNASCFQCHSSATRMARFVPDKPFKHIDDAHQWLPDTRFHWQALRCVDCHTSASEDSHHLPHDIGKKEKAERDCARCHTRDTVLKGRLYLNRAKQAGDAADSTFANSYMLADAYVVGATRNLWLDRAALVILGLAAGAIALHVAARLVVSRRRKGSDD